MTFNYKKTFRGVYDKEIKLRKIGFGVDFQGITGFISRSLNYNVVFCTS